MRVPGNLHIERKGIIFFLLWLTVSFIAAIPTHGQNPFIPKYDAVKHSERCFSVTPEAENQFGTVWGQDKIDFSKDTVLNFVVCMGANDNGANGISFLIHKDPVDTVSDPNIASYQFQPSVAIEIDTWNDADVQDGLAGTDGNGVVHPTSPYYGMDHTSVVYNGDVNGSLQQISNDNGVTYDRILPLKPDALFPGANNIEDGGCYIFQIRWDVKPDGTQDLELYIDTYDGSTNTGGLQLIMQHNDDMITNVFGGDASDVRFGITGSTGASYNEQTVCILEENAKPLAQDDNSVLPLNSTAIIDVASNDIDPDGDPLYVPIILDPANHGLVTIFDSLDINYLKYTPNLNYVGPDTIAYVTCDANSTNDYAKCDTAYVYVSVDCVPYDVVTTPISPNMACSDSVPSNGSASAQAILFSTIWYEGFEDLNNGDTVDTGITGWSFSKIGNCTSNGDQVRVDTQNGGQKFRVQNSGCEIEWITDEIDISPYQNKGVNVGLNVESFGNFENDDYIKVYYRVDGGPLQEFNNGIHIAEINGIQTAFINGIFGDILQIVVHVINNHGNEEYFWDNLSIEAEAPTVTNVTFNWYEGSIPSAPSIYTGPVANGLNDGIYTVVAIDQTTGCISNPANVTIDSAGFHVLGGYIEQLAPFTNCKLPYDGALEAGIINGIDTVIAGYTFEWYYQEDPKTPSFLQSKGAIFSNLESREYAIVITEIASGCDTTINEEVVSAVIIPTVAATTLADVISCSDPNTGSGEATVGGITNGYNFEWYVGPAIGAGPPDYTTSTVNTFQVGTYTVQAIDTITACASESRSITISDQSVLPDVLINVASEQISCDTLAPTGEFSGAANEGGVPTTAGYTFNWYKGPNDIIAARNGYTGGATVDSLEAGPYRLVVVADITNCTSFIDTLIQDMRVAPPDITLSTVDVTSCAISNGSITINVVGNPADYIYDIYTGFGAVPDSLQMTSNSNIITNLSVGNYTVIARDVLTKCETNSITTTINDASVIPTATFTSQDQVSCDPNNLTGQLTASVAIGVIADYTFEWFENDTSGAPVAPSSVDGEIISNLDSGNYALRITRNTTQCRNVLYPSVNLGIVLPVELVSAIPSTNCGTAANGQLVATVDGGLTEVDGYTFIWESVANADTLPATTSTATSLVPGDYILTVINDATTCASNPAPVNVADNTMIPDPVLSIADNASCDVNNPNGEVQVTGINNEPNPLSDYNYTWYDGNSAGPQLVVPNVSYPNDPDSSQIAGSSASTVALVITNSITTCSNEVLSIINDINIKPIIDAVAVDHVDNCVEPYLSGASIVSVNGGLPVPVGFTFGWTNLDGGPVISGNGSSISDVDFIDEKLPQGNYQVIVYNEFGCPSDPYTFTINDIAIPPTFSLSRYNNISCDITSPEGSLLATRPDASYTISSYEWFENNTGGTLLSTTLTGDSVLYNRDAGTYAVRITDTATGCTSVEYATIQDAPSNAPIILNSSNIGLTSCINPDGKLGFRVTPFEKEPPLNTILRTYTFYLNGSASYNQSSAGTDSANFTNLAEGNWNAWVIDEYSHCQSDTVVVTMDDAPAITVTFEAIKFPTSCLGTDGILKIYSETPTNDSISGGSGFNYDWFLGADGSQGSVPFTTAANKFSSNAVNIVSNYYFVEIEDLETGCKADTSVFIASITLPDLVNVMVTPSDRCAPFANGSVSTELTSFVPGLGYSDYNILLFEGSTFNTSWPTDTTGLVHTILTPAGGPVVFPADLKAGVYTMVVKEDFGDCFSNPVQVNVDLNFTFPELSISNTPDKSCSGAPLGTGQLEVLSTSPVIPLTDFSFEWFIASTPVAIGVQTPAELFAGNYNVVGEITANVPGQGCIGDSLISLPKVLDTLNIVEAVTPNRNCIPKDGAIQITDIEENGTGVGVPGNYVNFNIFDANLVALAPAIGDGVAIPWGEISPGNYYLQAQNNITKCLTEIKQVTIDDLSQDPAITIALNSPDYGCNLAAATGELEAFATAGNQNIAEYAFTWYQGDISGPVVSNLPLASKKTANSSTQLYTIEIEDINGANLGCISTKEYTLLHQPTKVNVLSSQLTINPQSNCGPNGSIVVNQINEDNGSGPVAAVPDYTGIYATQLLDKDLNEIDPVANPFAEFFPLNGEFGSGDIPAETYYVQASNIVTGCAFGPLTQVIVKDISKDPIISATLDSPDYACVGGTATGQLTPTAIGGFDGDNVQTNFNISWFVKSSGAVVPGGPIASNLMPDVYTLQVVDTSGVDQGCITTRDYVVTSAKHDIDITASALNQTICIPDGSAQIETITEDGSGIALPNAGWSVSLLDENTNDITPALPATGFAGNPFTSISEGVYFIQAQDNLTLCYSDPYQVIVDDLSVNPVIAIDVTTPQYSLNPNPASWTGAMQAMVTEITTGAPDPNGYTYSWHAGTDASFPSFSGLDNVSALDEGYYTFIAVSNSTGCESLYQQFVPFEYLEPIFNTSIIPQTICFPYNGSIEVTDIALDGNSDMLSDYTFNWHHDTYSSGDTPDAIILGNDVRTAYDDLKSGSYYIIARENWWMIDSYPLKVEVIDSSTNPIINFDATLYKPLTSCDATVIANGALAVNVYEDNTNPKLTPPFNYGYTWYTGSEVNSSNLIPGAINSSISGFPSGNYTVVVINLANNCQSENTFTIEDESVIPIVVASQSPNTNCPLEIVNGITSAKVINSTNPHNYIWYEGTAPSGSSAYTGVTWKDRPSGYYTVVAVDQELETCISDPVIVQVEDARVNPTVLINELSPVTNCDPERPNGVLSAVTQDGISGHTFEWYIDNTFYSEGPVASKLGLFEYQLFVTNDVTQCMTTLVSGPTQLLSIVPLPNVDILDDRTSCLAPDGIATASVLGNVTDYIFRYYHKSTGDELSNFYEDYTIYELDTSTYYVTAEDRNTGCISGQTEFAISNEQYFPEIDVMVDPSNCLEPSGAANVIISDLKREYSVNWYGENGFESKMKEIVYIPAGKYRVEVEGSDGCISPPLDVEVSMAILIYNGVSANYDGLNDFFKVDCLEHFPDNTVKIFSRSGLLVYEQDFYDLNDTARRFEGNSNKGTNLLGTELPIGTYFYVIDKKDGSKPNIGYLELVR